MLSEVETAQYAVVEVSRQIADRATVGRPAGGCPLFASLLEIRIWRAIVILNVVSFERRT